MLIPNPDFGFWASLPAGRNSIPVLGHLQTIPDVLGTFDLSV